MWSLQLCGILLPFLEKVNFWFVGSSIIKRAARTRLGPKNLNLPNASIYTVAASIRRDLASWPHTQAKTPAKIWQQAWNIVYSIDVANDIGHIPIRMFIHILRSTLEEVEKIFPQTNIIWSCTLPGFNWCYSSKVKTMEKN